MIVTAANDAATGIVARRRHGSTRGDFYAVSYKWRDAQMKTCVLTVAVSLTAVSSASADIYNIDTSRRGWINQVGDSNGAFANNNFLAGNCGILNCDIGEYRNWFEFDLTGISDPILSAELIINSSIVNLQQGGSVTYDVTSFDGSFVYNNLGRGTAYGSRDYVPEDDNQVHSIPLSAAAIADMNSSGGAFLISGRVSAGANFGHKLDDQLIFGSSQSSTVQLVVETIPAPGSVACVTLAGIGLGVRRRR